jgi:long-subunit acyl-CoA synthetase (AMP-forming)
VVKEAWTVENTLMTPTLKVKRNVLEQIYEEKLHTWYEHADTVLWEE